MNKSELQPIQELAEKRSSLSRVVSQNEKLKVNVDAPLGEGGFTIVPRRKVIKREMSFPEVKAVANFNLRHTPEKIGERKEELKAKIDADSQKRQSELAQIDQQLEELAPVYVAVLNTMTDEVTELAELTVMGGLTEEEFIPFKEEFDRVASLPDQLPGLKRGIEKLESQPEEQIQEKDLGELVKPALQAIGDAIERLSPAADEIPVQTPEPTGYAGPHPGLLVDALEYPPIIEKPKSPKTAPRTESTTISAEKEKTKVKIYRLPDGTYKIGERVIKTSGRKYEGQKDYSEDRESLLRTLIDNQGKWLTVYEWWENTFGSDRPFDREVIRNTKDWCDNHITFRNEPIVNFNHKRGPSAAYGITRFDVELIEPGKKPAAQTPTVEKAKTDAEKPFTPKTEDVYQFPDGTEIRGMRARLTRIVLEELSNPMLYVTSNDLAIMLTGSDDKAAKDTTGDTVTRVRSILRDKLGIELVSNYKRNSFKKQEVRYWVVRPTDTIPDALRGSVKLVPQPKGKLAEKLLYGEGATATEPTEVPNSGNKPQLIDVFRFRDQSEVRGEAAKLLQLVQHHVYSDPETSISKMEMAKAMFGSTDEDALRRLDNLVAATNKLLDLRNVGFQIASGFVSFHRGQEERYYRQRPTAEAARTQDKATEEAPVETTEEKIQRLVPTIEEAALLVGYFKFREDIFRELGITPPSDNLRDKLEHAMEGKNGRSEKQIMELRRTGLQKARDLLQNELLDTVIDRLEADHPICDLLNYLLDMEYHQIDLSRESQEGDKPTSALDFMEILIGAQEDLARTLNVQTYRIGDDKEVRLTTASGEVLFRKSLTGLDSDLRVDESPGGDEEVPPVEVSKERSNAILEDLIERLSEDTAPINVEDFEAEMGALETPETPGGAVQEDELILTTRPQPTHEELAAAFLASEAASRREGPADPELVEMFTDDLRELYEDIGGLDTNGVSFRTLQGRFPNLQISDLRKAFERGHIPRSLRGGRGGVQLTPEACVRLLFYTRYKDQLETVSAKPYKRALAAAWAQVKTEREQAQERTPGVDEDGFIEG